MKPDYYDQFILIRNTALLSEFQVEAVNYLTAPPTDPDVKISFIRFLGSNVSETKQAPPRLAHNFATLLRKNQIE